MIQGTEQVPKFLVVEDDARWTTGLLGRPYKFVFARDLASGLALIDERHNWGGAIFDRFLLEGDVPISAASIRQDAGFILAAEFLRCFPCRKVCIVSGDPDIGTVQEGLRGLVELSNCKFIFKGRPRSQELVLSFLNSGSVDASLLDSVLDHLVLEPNVFGLGINLSEFIRSIRDYALKRRAQNENRPT
jgi:hypothetical protein